MLKKMYDWTLHWANTRYGNIALILLSFMESSFFPIPPDVLLIALVLASHEKTSVKMPDIPECKTLWAAIKFLLVFSIQSTIIFLKNFKILFRTFPGSKAFKYARNCTIASVIGGLFGYAIGMYLWYSNTGAGEFSAIANFFFTHIPGFTIPLFEKIRILYKDWDFWIVFTAGFTPIPYKVFTITAGVCKINIFTFSLASIIGRAGRFYIVAFMLWVFGDGIKTFIDKYFNILSLVFVALIILGFAAIKLLV